MKKFSLFLILSLSLTAFLIGYLLIGEDLITSSKSKTGTILDKFEEQTTNNDATSTENESSMPFLLTSKKVVSLAGSRDKNSVFYYEKGTGKLFEFNFDEKMEKNISDTILPNFISGAWSATRKEVIQSFYSQSGQDYRHYSFSTSKTTRLNPNIHSLAFSSGGNTIAYYYLEEEPADSGQSELSENAPVGPPTEQVGKIVLLKPMGNTLKKY